MPAKNARASEDYNALSVLIVTLFQNGLKKADDLPKLNSTLTPPPPDERQLEFLDPKMHLTGGIAG
jgi:hypothetical protein